MSKTALSLNNSRRPKPSMSTRAILAGAGGNSRGTRVSRRGATGRCQYFQASDQSAGSTPAHIPTWPVADLAGDYVIAGHFRILGGVSNLTNRHYYSRVFLFGGMLEPASDRSFYAGAAYDF